MITILDILSLPPLLSGMSWLGKLHLETKMFRFTLITLIYFNSGMPIHRTPETTPANHPSSKLLLLGFMSSQVEHLYNFWLQPLFVSVRCVNTMRFCVDQRYSYLSILPQTDIDIKFYHKQVQKIIQNLYKYDKYI